MAGNPGESSDYCTGLKECQGREYNGLMADCRACSEKERVSPRPEGQLTKSEYFAKR